MNTLAIFLVMCSYTDNKSMIASQLALATMHEQVVTTKVPRNECKVCGGTGKVDAGDGVTKVTRDCDNCYPVARAEIPRKAKNKRWYFFTAVWCAPCGTAKGNLVPNKSSNAVLEVMMAYGWTVGNDDSYYFQMVDYNQNPQLSADFKITTLPTFVLIEDDKEILRYTGIPTAKQLSDAYYD